MGYKMRSDPTRRRFLGQVAALGAAVTVPMEGWAAEGATGSLPEMTIARWGEQLPDPELSRVATQLTERAIAQLDGMTRFVGKGDVVWVKPNMGWNRYSMPAQK